MSAWQQGFDARLADAEFSDNPHPYGTPDWVDWAIGWQEQDRHMADKDEALDSIGWFG